MITSMVEQQTACQFTANALKNPYADLSIYSNQAEYESLRETALEHIHSMLFKIHIDQINDEAAKRPFSLKAVINEPDPESGCTLLDYCLIAGLDELALHLASIGGATSNTTAGFEHNVLTTFKDALLAEPIPKVLASIANIKKGQENYKRSIPKEDVSFWHSVKAYVNDNRKYSCLLFLIGIGCICASPFSGGWSSILFLTIGVPATIASITATQAANSAQLARDQISDQTREYFEAKEVRQLLKLTRSLQQPSSKIAEEQNVRVTIHHGKPEAIVDENDHRLIFINNSTETVPEDHKNRKSHEYISQP